MSSSSTCSPFVKPVVGAISAFALDKMLLKQDMKKSAIFGASVGIALYVAPMVSTYLPVSDSKTSFGNGKEIMSRGTEIALSVATCTILNKFVFKNDVSGSMVKKLAVIIVADIVSEYAADYCSGRPLAVF